MRLLSFQTEQSSRAGIVFDDKALDVTAFLAITRRAETDEVRDALDLFLRGMVWLRAITSQLRADAGLRNECLDRGALKPIVGLKLNPPVIKPGKILAVGLNYAAHATEQNIEPPARPLIFSKNVTALSGNRDWIQLPAISDKVDYEAELAFVIGREAKSVKAEQALDYIAGFTIMNDVTARDLQKNERQWARAKGLDTFAPCGPWLVTVDEIADPHSLDIRLRVNGETRQDSSTADMIFKIPELVEFISQDLTLKPGDIVSTGTPSGVGVHRAPPVFLKAGDVIEIEIEGIGLLSNPVAGAGAGG